MLRSFVSLLFAASLLAQVAVDPAREKELLSNLQSAVAAGDAQLVLRHSRRALELYPNDPMMQAPIFQLMGAASASLGDADRQVAFQSVAHSIQPALAPQDGKGSATRGEKAAKFENIMQVIAVGAASYSQMRMQIQQNQLAQAQLKMQQMQMQMQMLQQQQQMQQGQPVAYQQQPMPMQPQQPPMQQPPTGTGGPFSQPQNQYAAPAPVFYGAPPQATTRGASSRGPVMQLIQDLSRVGALNYFEPSESVAVQAVEGGLRLWPAGSGPEMWIPVADVIDLRMNSVVAKDLGAFHLATRNGLYLNLMLPSGNIDAAAQLLADLREQLGLSE